MLISCTDQLSPTGGSFELRFSRCASSLGISNPNTLAPPAPALPIQFTLRSNPHEEAEPYLRQILRHGSLAPSLHRLVGLLRDTLPIAVEIDRLGAGTGIGRSRQVKSTEEPWFDTVVKGIGWWRVLYGDLRYVLHPQHTLPCLSTPCLCSRFFQTRARFKTDDRQTHRYTGRIAFALSRRCRAAVTAGSRFSPRLSFA